LDYTHTAQGTRWNDTNGFQHLTNIRIDLGRTEDDKAPDTGNWDRSTLADLEKAAKFYRGNTNYPQAAASASAAETILTALNKFAPDLKELQDAAANRPLSRFPIQYGHNPPFEILLPHLAQVKGFSLVCELRAVAELEMHRTNEAFADLQTGFRLSDSVRD